CALEIQVGQTFANFEDVIMRVGQTGHDRFASEIGRARGRTGIFLRGVGRADEKNAVAFDGNRFGLRLSVVYGVNVAIEKNCVRRFGGLAVGTGKKDKGKNEQQNQMLHVQFGGRFSRKAAIPSLASADSRASM